jgi:kynurenine formamidase
MEITMQQLNKKIYDLSVPVGRNLPTYAMSLNFYNPPMFATYSNYSTTVFEKVYDRGETMYDTMLAFYAHTGTHLDAPLHCSKNGWAVNEIPLDYLWGSAVVVGIPKGELGEITPADLEKATPKIEKGDIVIINTGWHKNFCGPITDWNKAVYYAHKNPGIKGAGAQWLIDKGIKVLGVDYIGVDHPAVTERGDGSWPCHKGILAKNIPMLQVLGGQIDEVTGKRCQICFAPVPYVGGDAFPVRVLAMVDE